MEINAAVLEAMDASSPYATSKPLTLEKLELDPPGPGEVLVRIKAAGFVPLGSVSDQRQPASADADGSRT